MENLRQDEAKAYNKSKRILTIISLLINFIFLIFLLFSKATHLFRDIGDSISTSPGLIILIYLLIVGGLSEVISLPLEFYGGYTLEHKFKLSNQRVKDWALDHIKELLVSLVLTFLVIELVYFLLRRYPSSWWIIAGVIFVLFLIALVNLAPILLMPIFFKFTPLKDSELKERLLLLSKRANTQVKGIFECNLSKKSKKSNAALAGLGNTRRIILADNLLKSFKEDEVEVILAHELGHHIYNHLWKGIGLEVILIFSGFYLANLCLGNFSNYFGFGGIADIAGLPLLILAISGLSLFLLPLFNLYSRRLETQADDYALNITKNSQAFITTMKRLAEQNLAEVEPNKIIEFIFYSHPSIGKRIKRAERFTSNYNKIL